VIFADALTGGYIGGNLTAIACVLIGVALVFAGLRSEYDGAILMTGGVVTVIATVGIWIWASWPPFAYENHHWIDKEITVAEVSKRQVSDGDKGFYEKFVVRTSAGELYGIDDTRAALVKPGAELKLRCKKAYQFGIPRAAHGWDCRWSA
jgi:hypothetical protein